MFETLCWCGRLSGSGGRHVKGEHLKNAANAAFQEKSYAAARGDPDASPTPDKVRSAAKAAFEPIPNTRVPPPAPALR